MMIILMLRRMHNARRYAWYNIIGMTEEEPMVDG